MSKVRSDNISNRADDGAPKLVFGAEVPVGYGITGAGGINITGIATATSFSGNVTGNISGGTFSGTTGTFSGDVSIGDKIVHTGDTNTAIRFPAADTFSVETAGSERLRINSSGFVGVNTDSPGRQLTVSGGSAEGVIQITNNTSGAAGGNGFELLHFTSGETQLLNRENGAMRFDTNGTERVRITSDGKVGINQISPSHKLQVEDGSSGVIVAKQTTNNGGYNIFEGDASDGTTKFYVSHNGRVGAADGIIFGSDTAAANILDDYEEGTYTPTAGAFTVTGSTTLTGQYVKVGRQVTVGIKFANTGTIAHGVSCNISLPFAMASGTEAHGLIGMLDNSNSTAFNSNKSGVQCKLDGEGGSRFFVGSFTTSSNGANFLFGGTYIAAS